MQFMVKPLVHMLEFNFEFSNNCLCCMSYLSPLLEDWVPLQHQVVGNSWWNLVVTSIGTSYFDAFVRVQGFCMFCIVDYLKVSERWFPLFLNLFTILALNSTKECWNVHSRLTTGVILELGDIPYLILQWMSNLDSGWGLCKKQTKNKSHGSTNRNL